MIQQKKEKPLFSHEDILWAESIHASYGSSFYRGTKFFPKQIKDATCVLYTFVRIPDEYVDNPTDPSLEAISIRLNNWQKQWREDYRLGESREKIFSMMIKLCKHYDIPTDYINAFLSAMISDISITRYKTYSDLETYMYGSASVVGLMMVHIMGFKDAKALDHARALGEAFQLTNFLRDIDEDFQSRGRVYMPQDEMKKYGVNDQNIYDKINTENWKSFLKFQISRCRKLYDYADRGIPMIRSIRAGLGVTVARLLYSRILTEIEKDNYNIFGIRHRVSGVKKFFLIIYGLFYYAYLCIRFHQKDSK